MNNLQCHKCSRIFTNYYLLDKHLNRKIPCDAPRDQATFTKNRICSKCNGEVLNHKTHKPICIETRTLKLTNMLDKLVKIENEFVLLTEKVSKYKIRILLLWIYLIDYIHRHHQSLNQENQTLNRHVMNLHMRNNNIETYFNKTKDKPKRKHLTSRENRLLNQFIGNLKQDKNDLTPNIMEQIYFFMKDRDEDICSTNAKKYTIILEQEIEIKEDFRKILNSNKKYIINSINNMSCFNTDDKNLLLLYIDYDKTIDAVCYMSGIDIKKDDIKMKNIFKKIIKYEQEMGVYIKKIKIHKYNDKINTLKMDLSNYLFHKNFYKEIDENICNNIVQHIEDQIFNTGPLWSIITKDIQKNRDCPYDFKLVCDNILYHQTNYDIKFKYNSSKLFFDLYVIYLDEDAIKELFIEVDAGDPEGGGLRGDPEGDGTNSFATDPQCTPRDHMIEISKDYYAWRNSINILRVNEDELYSLIHHIDNFIDDIYGNKIATIKYLDNELLTRRFKMAEGVIDGYINKVNVIKQKKKQEKQLQQNMEYEKECILREFGKRSRNILPKLKKEYTDEDINNFIDTEQDRSERLGLLLDRWEMES
jgi:hypothetical protein